MTPPYMNRLLLILFFFCVYSHVYAQTPYDSFSPATSRPILDVVQDMDTYKDSLQSSPMDAPLATTDDVSKWLSVDPLSDKTPEISPYAYCNWNPVNYVDPNGLSTHTDEDGNVVAVYDDNDLNIYKHSNSKISSWGDVYANPLTTDDSEIMGKSLHAYSFAEQNQYNSTGETRHAQNMRIDFSSFELGDEVMEAINSQPSLLEYALNAKSRGRWDFKEHYTAGSQIFDGVYLSPRDAGNFLAGAVKGQSGMLSPIVQFGYGAYNLSGNSLLNTGLITLGTGVLMCNSPLLGITTATLIMNGENKLSQLSINIGFNYVRK